MTMKTTKTMRLQSTTITIIIIPRLFIIICCRSHSILQIKTQHTYMWREEKTHRVRHRRTNTSINDKMEEWIIFSTDSSFYERTLTHSLTHTRTNIMGMGTEHHSSVVVRVIVICSVHTFVLLISFRYLFIMNSIRSAGVLCGSHCCHKFVYSQCTVHNAPNGRRVLSAKFSDHLLVLRLGWLMVVWSVLIR